MAQKNLIFADKKDKSSSSRFFQKRSVGYVIRRRLRIQNSPDRISG